MQMSLIKCLQPSIEGLTGMRQSTANSHSSELLSQNGIGLVNKGQDILYRLNIDANSMVISYLQVQTVLYYKYLKIFIW